MEWMHRNKYALTIVYIYFILIGFWATPVSMDNEPMIASIEYRENKAYLRTLNDYVEKLQKLDAEEGNMINAIRRENEVETSMVGLCNAHGRQLAAIGGNFADLRVPQNLETLHVTAMDAIKTRVEMTKICGEAYAESNQEKLNQYKKLKKSYGRKMSALENMYKKICVE